MPGLFIVLDGPDASGTSTHTELLAERLKSMGKDVLLTSEPTDGPIGKKIRGYLRSGNIDPLNLQILFTQDREWHVTNVIQPALDAGKIVVCDRYWYSTIIYAEAQGLYAPELKEVNSKFIQPSLIFFTLPPIAVSLERMTSRATKEVFEKENIQRTIHDGYEQMAHADSSIYVIDTSGGKEDVSAQILDIVSKKL